MTRRDFLRATAWVIASTALAACAAPTADADQQDNPATPAADVLILRFHTRATQQENALYATQMEVFMAQHPKLALVQEAAPPGEYVAQLASLQASGDLGDVLWASQAQGSLLELWQQGMILPLDPLLDAANVDLNQWYPSCVQSIRQAGQLLGLPFKAHPGMAFVYYNQRLLEAAAVDLPNAGWTQTQQTNMAKKLTQRAANPPRFGYLPGIGSSWQMLTTLLPAFGGQLLDAAGTQVQLASAPGLAALEYLDDLFHNAAVAPQPDQLDGDDNNMWAEGELVMLQGVTRLAALETIVDERFAWMVAPNALGPAGIAGASCEVDVQCLTTATRHPDEALAWVNFLCSQESGLLLGRLGGTVGGRPDVYGAPELLQFPYRVIFQQVMENAPPSRAVANGHQAEAETNLQALLMPLWRGEAKPTPAFLANVAAQIQGILDKAPLQ